MSLYEACEKGDVRAIQDWITRNNQRGRRFPLPVSCYDLIIKNGHKEAFTKFLHIFPEECLETLIIEKAYDLIEILIVKYPLSVYTNDLLTIAAERNNEKAVVQIVNSVYKDSRTRAINWAKYHNNKTILKILEQDTPISEPAIQQLIFTEFENIVMRM